TLNPNQTPVKSFDVQGEVYVARRSTPVTRPAPLEPDLLADAHASVTYKRLGAVSGLASILDEKHPGRSLAARLELARLASHDDSLKVREQAQKVLDAAGDPSAPVIPDYEPALTTRGGAIVEGPPATEAAPDTDTSNTQTDTETGTETGGGGGGDGGSDPAGYRRIGMIVLGLLGVLVIGGFTWWSLNDDGTTSGADATGPVLPDTEILVGLKDPEPGQGIVALDINTGQTRPIISDPAAVLPTISEDRQWMVYLTDREVWGGVPRLARVDGSDDGRLLDADASEACPYTTRPAFSLDGGRLAAICLGASGEPLGVATIDRDGRLLNLVNAGDFTGAPTWTGNGRIIVPRDVEGDGTTTLWSISPDGGEQDPITDGLDGSDSHPDWSDHGLLFLREEDGSSDVFYLENADQGGVSSITSSGEAESPTWGPGDEPTVAWLQPAGEGARKTLWTTTLDEEEAFEENTADYGPPAWGSR
ncbi:MAG: TolB family protein, partial [Nocardioides sp.]